MQQEFIPRPGHNTATGVGELACLVQHNHDSSSLTFFLSHTQRPILIRINNYRVLLRDSLSSFNHVRLLMSRIGGLGCINQQASHEGSLTAHRS